MEVLYVKRKPNSKEGNAIDPNHTHFLLVENGKEEFGGEIDFRGKLEQAISQRFRVPNVLLVVQGGPGTYATVQKSIESGVRVILVKESRGAAQVIAEYIEPLLPDAEHLVTLNKDDLLARLKQRDDELAATFARLNRKMRPEQQKKLWDDLHYIAGRLDLLTIFS